MVVHAEYESELMSSGPGRVRWLANITLRDFALYQLTPTLVYELEYPRTERCAFFSLGFLELAWGYMCMEIVDVGLTDVLFVPWC